MGAARQWVVLVALGLVLPGCPEKEARPPPPPRDGKLGKQRCTSLPAKTNRRNPVFKRPFDGNFPVINLFDHQTPGEYRGFDSGGRQLTYCGLDMLGLPEGHEGYAWAVPQGTPVFPVADGEVLSAGVEPDFFCQLTKVLVSGQQVVEVHHKELGLVTTYRHLSEVLVNQGDKVEAAKRIGLSGQTGCTTEPMLFFAVKKLASKSGKPVFVDPYGWDGPADDPWAQDPTGSASTYLWKDGEAPGLGSR